MESWRIPPSLRFPSVPSNNRAARLSDCPEHFPAKPKKDAESSAGNPRRPMQKKSANLCPESMCGNDKKRFHHISRRVRQEFQPVDAKFSGVYANCPRSPGARREIRFWSGVCRRSLILSVGIESGSGRHNPRRARKAKSPPSRFRDKSKMRKKKSPETAP